MKRNFENMISEFFGPNYVSLFSGNSTTSNLCTDDSVVTRHGDRVECEIDMPGVDKGDIDVTIEGSSLLIVGKRKKIELKYRFTPGDQYDIDSTRAQLHNGVLLLTVKLRRDVMSTPKKVLVT